ncbi:MAG: TolC family protein, partial [Gammaproteobacteria bacterium]|nr:TolC family protein [Gammaproteobacteria bacterium]
AENRQRSTRAHLAYVLNHAGKLPSTVSLPRNLPQLKLILPEVELLQQQALERNNRILALRAEIESAEKKISAMRANTNPTLKGAGEANNYSQKRSSYDRWRLELRLEVPLITGNVNNAKVAREQARLYRLKAQLLETEEQLRQQVLELWLKLDYLRIQKEEAQAQSNYRELYLDRSRALYEMEVKADLGDAMVRITDAERDLIKTDFDIALAWETMSMLTGYASSVNEIEMNTNIQQTVSPDNNGSK